LPWLVRSILAARVMMIALPKPIKQALIPGVKKRITAFALPSQLVLPALLLKRYQQATLIFSN
jgi:hypothetical protein